MSALNNFHVRLAASLFLLLAFAATAVVGASPQGPPSTKGNRLLRHLQPSADPFEETAAADLPAPLESRGVSFEKILWEPLRNASAPILVATERLSQDTALALEEIPTPVNKLLPSLRGDRFSLPSATSEIGGVSGFCDKEKSYKFTHFDQLKDYRAEAECIYARGIAPERPPLGLWHGQVVEIINTDLFNALTERLWTGKISVKTQCHGSNRPGDGEVYLLYNFFMNRPSLPAFMYTGTLRDPLAPGEYDDGGRHLFVDYVVDFSQVCPMQQGPGGTLNIGVMNDPWPLSQMVDMVRKIGEQEDGGSILLGKSIIRDTWGFPDSGDTTVAFWTVVNYDSEAWPKREDWTLGPLTKDFSWFHTSSTHNVARLVSIDEFVRNPTKTSLDTLNEIVRKPRGQPAFGQEWDRIHAPYLMAGNPDRLQDLIAQANNTSSPSDDNSSEPLTTITTATS